MDELFVSSLQFFELLNKSFLKFEYVNLLLRPTQQILITGVHLDTGELIDSLICEVISVYDFSDENSRLYIKQSW
jgi:hypothetical protein